MEFSNHQAIYLQIVDYACEQILIKNWVAEEKIPSIRDLSVELQVNPNTVQRSYDFLQELGVISNRRGVGIFVEKEAVKRVMLYKKKEFTKRELPVFFKNMHLLKMDISELEILFDNYLKSHKKS
ncbi:MAG: GntR family transcriptional regulator [Bacteroidota bacterium]|nr:GntR family transcriptional regulator [Bacteroidota bacterium]